jgi:nucleoid DNA-binding protein
MNKTKISAQDIIDSLAAKTEITKQQADDFFKAFIATIEETLLANAFVKIKNLGTFKLNWVAPRKSVNVQTGEDIEIDGFYKVVFMPEKNLKELINAPFAHLESVSLDGEKPQEEPNSMASLRAQAGTIKNLLTEIQAMSQDETTELPEVVEEKSTTAEEELVIADLRTHIHTDHAENIEAVENEEVDVVKAVAETPKEKQPEIVTAKIETEERPKQIERPNYYEQEEEKKNRTGWWVLLGILLFLGILVALYFIPPQNNAFQHWVNKNIFGYDTAHYDAIRERARARMEEQQRTVDYQQEQAKQETQPVVQDDFSRAFDDRLNNPQILITIEMNHGNRLSHLAQRHFGSPHFWVYIYEVNRDIVTDPNVIAIGTMIRIPRIDPQLVDANNPRAMEQALQLHEKYLNQR